MYRIFFKRDYFLSRMTPVCGNSTVDIPGITCIFHKLQCFFFFWPSIDTEINTDFLMFMQRILLAFLAFLSLSLPGKIGAEELQLKNGDRISGKIWRITGETILIETPYLSLSLPRIYVQKIILSTESPPVRIVPVRGTPFSGKLINATSDGLEILRIQDTGDPVRVNLPHDEIQEVIFFEDGYEFSGTEEPLDS